MLTKYRREEGGKAGQEEDRGGIGGDIKGWGCGAHTYSTDRKSVE